MPSRRAFALVDLVFVGAAVSLFLAPALSSSRRAAREVLCQANQRQWSVAGMNYATDYKDRFATFTWRTADVAPDVRALFPERLLEADLDAHAYQALDIIRRRSPSGRIASAPRAWRPELEWTHLVLMDYLAANLADPIAHCPSDPVRSAWLDGTTLAPTDQPWAFSTSYHQMPAAYQTDAPGGRRDAFTQGAGQHELKPDLGPKGDVRPGVLSFVAFPSMKAQFTESIASHTAPAPLFFTDPLAENFVAFIDGHVAKHANKDMNLGGRTIEGRVERINIAYTPRPDLGEPAWRAAAGEPTQPGRVRWTLGGLKGIDIGGPEPKGD